MENKEILKLIKNNRDNIISRIEQVEVISLTPGFYGIYDIYMDESGELYVYQSYQSGMVIEHTELIFLYAIESRAIDNKQWFGNYLFSDYGVYIEKVTEEHLKLYSQEYEMWKKMLGEEVRNRVMNADKAYEYIVSIYENALK